MVTHRLLLQRQLTDGARVTVGAEDDDLALVLGLDGLQPGIEVERLTTDVRLGEAMRQQIDAQFSRERTDIHCNKQVERLHCSERG